MYFIGYDNSEDMLYRKLWTSHVCTEVESAHSRVYNLVDKFTLWCNRHGGLSGWEIMESMDYFHKQKIGKLSHWEKILYRLCTCPTYCATVCWERWKEKSNAVIDWCEVQRIHWLQVLVSFVLHVHLVHSNSCHFAHALFLPLFTSKSQMPYIQV